QRAAPIVKIKIEQDPDREHGRDEDPEKLGRVVIDPSVENRLTAEVDVHRRIALGIDDDLADFVEDARVVEASFEEAASYQRRLVVERDVASENDPGIFVDIVPELVEIVLSFGNVAIGQNRSVEDYAIGQRAEVAGSGERANRAVLDAVNK